jgi:hypothetical protein
MTTGYDPITGRPLIGEHEAVETLADEELEAELTIAMHDAERRPRRFELLVHELLRRQRGYGRSLSPQGN